MGRIIMRFGNYIIMGKDRILIDWYCWLKGLGSSFSLLAVAVLMGCRSVERAEMVEVHDTLRIVMTDTVVRESVLTVRDTVTVRVTDSVIVKVDAEGNVSKERYHEEDRLRTEDRLQTTDYRQRTTEDRKRTTEDRQQTTDNRLRTTEETWWDRLKGVLSMLGAAVLGYIVGWYVKRRPPAER